MSLIVVLAKQGNASRMAEIHIDAFSTNLMLQAQFSTLPTLQALRQAIELKSRAHINDPYQTVLLVEVQCEDATSGACAKPTQGSKAIAYAKWSHPVPAGETYVEQPCH